MTDTETRRAVPVRSESFDPGDRWVPVDRRWLGLDRRSIAPAFVVLALTMLMVVVLPLVDGGTAYNDEVVAGDVMELEGGITFVPAVGWGVVDGVRARNRPVSGTYPATATVVDGDDAFTVRTAPFDGDAAALLGQIETTTTALESRNGFQFTSDPIDVTTDDGDRGVAVRFQGPSSDGMIAAFVLDGMGVKVVAYGAPEVADDSTTGIGAMLASISRPTAGAH